MPNLAGGIFRISALSVVLRSSFTKVNSGSHTTLCLDLQKIPPARDLHSYTSSFTNVNSEPLLQSLSSFTSVNLASFLQSLSSFTSVNLASFLQSLSSFTNVNLESFLQSLSSFTSVNLASFLHPFAAFNPPNVALFFCFGLIAFFLVDLSFIQNEPFQTLVYFVQSNGMMSGFLQWFQTVVTSCSPVAKKIKTYLLDCFSPPLSHFGSLAYDF